MCERFIFFLYHKTTPIYRDGFFIACSIHLRSLKNKNKRERIIKCATQLYRPRPSAGVYETGHLLVLVMTYVPFFLYYGVRSFPVGLFDTFSTRNLALTIDFGVVIFGGKLLVGRSIGKIFF